MHLGQNNKQRKSNAVVDNDRLSSSHGDRERDGGNSGTTTTQWLQPCKIFNSSCFLFSDLNFVFLNGKIPKGKQKIFLCLDV